MRGPVTAPRMVARLAVARVAAGVARAAAAVVARAAAAVALAAAVARAAVAAAPAERVVPANARQTQIACCTRAPAAAVAASVSPRATRLRLPSSVCWPA